MPKGISRHAEARKREEKAQRAQKRRRARILRSAALALLIALVGGGVLYALNQRANEVYDLSRIGRGTPAVVQVHDITCPVCTELRGNVERIQDEFADNDLLIRVADVDDEAGVAFAARYTDARRATLLFLDGDGELVQEYQGALSTGELRELFSLHAEGGLRR
jgi:hypothetical protein